MSTGFAEPEEQDRVELGRVDEEACVRFARERTRRFLEAHGCDGVTEDVVLVVSELVTNALLHARQEPVLEIRRDGGRLVVEVADPAPADTVAIVSSPQPVGGWGLRLVANLATRWGVRPEPEGGKTVWAEFDLR